MKSLLAVSWWFPPLLGPRSIQVAKGLDQLAKKGWQITVVTTDQRNLPFGIARDERLVEVYCKDLNIVRETSPWQTPFHQALGKALPGTTPLPDPQIHWASKAMRELPDRLDPGSFDAILSFGQPWAVHLLAERIAERSSSPWLAFFSDPWADNPYYRKLSTGQRARMLKMENKVISAADKLVFTNEPTVELVMQKYSVSTKAKAKVVPHGFDPQLEDKLPQIKFDKNPAKLTLLHLGAIYGIRSPQTLFQSLELLKRSPQVFGDLDLVFVGAVSRKSHWQKMISEMGLEKLVRFEGRVAYLESLAIGKQADVLVTLDAPSNEASVFLPSKLVEYLALGRVILGITPTRGVSADLLRSLDMPIADPQNPPEIAAAIHDLHTRWKQKDLTFSHQNSEVASQYSIETTTDLLESALLEMINAQ